MRRGTSTQSGFTLLEVMASLAIASVLLVGVGSAVLLTTRALPRGDRPTDAILQESRTLTRLLGELEAARVITERTATAITFTLPDRNGDGLPERIRYAWSGTAGGPLTRQMNGDTATTVVDNVQQFSLTYDLESASEQYSGLPVESAETALSTFTSGNKEYTVDTSHYIGQYLAAPLAPLPVNTISWRPTRVQAFLRKTGAVDATMRAQIRAANADKTPSDAVIDEATAPEPNNTSYAWFDFPLSGTTQISPSQSICIVLAADVHDFQVRYDNSGAYVVSSSNAGATWSVTNSANLLYALYGKYVTPTAPVTLTRQYVTGVRVMLRAGSDASARLDTGVRPLNAPEVLAMAWEADFQSDPTTADLNGDGVADWVYGIGPGAPTPPSGGSWTADRTLTTSPANDFTQLTCVEVSFQDTLANATGGAGVKMAVDSGGGQCGVIYANLQQVVGGTQTMTVDIATDATHTKRVAMVSGLPQGWQELRLICNPANDTVNVNVNGADAGTFAYPRFAGESLRGVQLYGQLGETQAKFHAVRVRVGGSVS